jgi:NDP-sugar pyrophosphorylase family protein
MTQVDPSTFFTIDPFAHHALFEDIDYVWQALDYLIPYLAKIPLGEIKSPIPSGVTLVDPHLITIEEGCVIEPGAYIRGPCVIGAGTTIRHGAYIRGHVITGESCVIGHASEVKSSILFPKAAAPHFNYVGDSILGASTNLGAGAICANMRFDKKEVKVAVSGKVIPTGRKKLGLILGDGAQLGCHVVTNPGTMIGRGAICMPGLNIGGFIKDHEVVKHSPFSSERSSWQ